MKPLEAVLDDATALFADAASLLQRARHPTEAPGGDGHRRRRGRAACARRDRRGYRERARAGPRGRALETGLDPARGRPRARPQTGQRMSPKRPPGAGRDEPRQ
jgi:hypothetical protein